jgi:hypothetical protein
VQRLASLNHFSTIPTYWFWMNRPRDSIIDGRRLLREVINDLKRRGRTVLLISTFYLKSSNFVLVSPSLPRDAFAMSVPSLLSLPLNRPCHQIVHGGGGR